MDEEWYLGVLPEFGLEPAWLAMTDGSRVEVGLGKVRGCLWRRPSTPCEQALLTEWEGRLKPHGLVAARLAAKGGTAWVSIDERTVAILTCWQGADLPRPASTQDLVPVASFLGRFRALGAAGGLRVPVRPGLSWVDSWQERRRRLKSFARLAAERLNPTRFDLVYLEQLAHFDQEAACGSA